jgi:hypothetical protein
MIVALHIVVYMLTLVFMFFLSLNDLREEKGKVTVGDVLVDIPLVMYIPIINTMALIVIGILFLIWEIFGIRTLFKKLWDKIKDIEL